MLQIPAGWGFTGLDERTSEKLYNKAKLQLSVGPMPDALRTMHTDAVLEANALLGIEETTDEEVGAATHHVPFPFLFVRLFYTTGC